MIDWVLNTIDRLIWRIQRRRQHREEERSRILIEFWSNPDDFMRRLK
jgi:hypothetical protein